MRREKGDFIAIHKLINNLEETDRKHIILKRKGNARYLLGHNEKILYRNLPEHKKKRRQVDTSWNYLVGERDLLETRKVITWVGVERQVR